MVHRVDWKVGRGVEAERSVRRLWQSKPRDGHFHQMLMGDLEIRG